MIVINGDRFFDVKPEYKDDYVKLIDCITFVELWLPLKVVLSFDHIVKLTMYPELIRYVKPFRRN